MINYHLSFHMQEVDVHVLSTVMWVKMTYSWNFYFTCKLNLVLTDVRVEKRSKGIRILNNLPNFCCNFWKMNIYLTENAKQWLDMVTRNRITDEGPPFIPHKIKKSLRIKPGQFTVPRIPPPVQVARIRPPISHAILMTFNCMTGNIAVNRTRWVRDPFSRKQITFFWNHILYILIKSEPEYGKLLHI